MTNWSKVVQSSLQTARAAALRAELTALNYEFIHSMLPSARPDEWKKLLGSFFAHETEEHCHLVKFGALIL